MGTGQIAAPADKQEAGCNTDGDCDACKIHEAPQTAQTHGPRIEKRGNGTSAKY